MSIIPFPNRHLLPSLIAAASPSAAAASPGEASRSRVKALDEMQALFSRKPSTSTTQSKIKNPQSSIVNPPTQTEVIRRGHAALKKLTGFIGPGQLATVRTCLRGEEGQWFMEKMEELAARIQAMPVTYGQDGKGDDAICYLHYFGRSYDGYLTEKDMEESADPAEAQWQAHGYVHWSQFPGKLSMGYICLPEIFASHMELDFHFEPTPVREIKREHGVTVEEVSEIQTADAADPIVERQKKFLVMPDGYQPGAIIYCSWGYEQTNINFYRIEKRSGDFVTLIPLCQRDRQETHFMSGTTMPADTPKDYAKDHDPAWSSKDMEKPKPAFRRKLNIRDGHINGLNVFGCGWASLWDGNPMTWSSYA